MKPDVEMYFQDPFEQFNRAFKKLMQVGHTGITNCSQKLCLEAFYHLYINYNTMVMMALFIML